MVRRRQHYQPMSPHIAHGLKHARQNVKAIDINDPRLADYHAMVRAVP
jgi:hypothetical protein